MNKFAIGLATATFLGVPCTAADAASRAEINEADVVVSGDSNGSALVVRANATEAIVADGRGMVAAGPGCVPIDGRRVRCDVLPRTAIRVSLALDAPGSSVVAEAVSALWVYGSRRSDRISVSAPSSRVSGYAGNDRIIGGPGADELSGDEGADRLEGRGGADRLIPNYLLERDSFFERVMCGSGRDTAVATTGLDLLAPDCESVSDTEGETTPTRPVRRNRRSLTYRVPCAADYDDCSGTVRLSDVQGRVLGEGRFGVLKRFGGRVKVRLTARGRRLLSRRGGAIARYRARYETGLATYAGGTSLGWAMRVRIP